MKRRAHTTIATVLAVVAICAIAVPTASAKPPKPGSQEAKAVQCANLKDAYDINYDYAQQARASGNWELYHKLIGYATSNYEAALNLRCSWAIGSRLSETQTASGPILDAPVLDAR